MLGLAAGCRAAAFLQKLPWLREAKSGEPVGLLSR
jgi:hypothetical protein